METVEVVIKITKYRLDAIKWACKKMPPTENQDLADYVYRDIANGTVLPKGHGRLIDADAATKDINTFQDAFATYTDNMGKYNIVCAAPTVIEADKDGE